MNESLLDGVWYVSFTLSAVRLSLLLSLPLLELHVPMVHHCSSQLVNAYFLFAAEA